MPRWQIFILPLLAACAGEIASPAEPIQRANPELRGPTQQASRTESTPGAGLVGATPETLRAILGEPLLRRAEGQAQIWLYAGGGCHLDIVLYTGEAGSQVAHIHARAGGIAQRSPTACLRDISAQAARTGRGFSSPPVPARPAIGDEFDV